MTVRAAVEHRKKDKGGGGSLPVWADVVGSYSDAQISAAIDAAKQLPSSPAAPDMVQVVWPVLVMPVTAAALDFGDVSQITVRLGQLVASQTWIQLDRLIAHISDPGGRGGDKKSPFVSLPITTEGSVIIDGHHSLTALWLLAGSEFEVPVWFVPIGLATGHPR